MTVEDEGNLVLTAGIRVAFDNGFEVLAGGEVTADGVSILDLAQASTELQIAWCRRPATCASSDSSIT